MATGSAAWAACGHSLVQTSEIVCFGRSLVAGCENSTFCLSLVLQGCYIICGLSLVVGERDTSFGFTFGSSRLFMFSLSSAKI